MNFRRVVLNGIAAAAIIVGCGNPSWSAGDGVKQMVATRVSAPPVMDGTLNDPAWAKAPETGGFTILGTVDKMPTAPTYIKVLTDGDALYLGFRCVEPNLQDVKTQTMPRDGDIWAQESVEVLLDVAGDHKECYHFIGAISGTEYDSYLRVLPTGAIDDDSKWDGNWELKTSKGSGEWYAEMKIPFSTLGADLSKHPVLGAEFNRARWVGKEELTNWSPNSVRFVELQNIGELIIPDAEGSYCNVQFPRLRSVVAGTRDILVPILNHTSQTIRPKMVYRIIGAKTLTGEAQMDPISPENEPTAMLSLNIGDPGPYQLQVSVTDSASGKSLYTLIRDMTVTQPVVFDEALHALYMKRADATLDVQEPADGAKLRVSLLKDGSKSPVAIQMFTPPFSAPIRVSFPLSKQNGGNYRMRAEMVRDGKTVATATSRIFPYKPNPKIGFDKDGYMVLGGKPFFPVGIYSLITKDAKPDDGIMQEAKKAGFNSTVLYSEDPKVLMPILDACQRNGIKAIIYPTLPFSEWKEDPKIERVHQDIDVRKKHPAVISWYVVDEPEGIGKAPVGPVRDMYQTIKEYDPDHPCTMVVMSPRAAKDYHACSDIMWSDPYPVPKHPISQVAECVGGVAKNIDADKPMWAILQAFDWSVWFNGKIDGVHRPNADEERCMTYEALVNGAKGIIYWAFSSSKYQTMDYPQHWAELKKVSSEVHDLTPVLLTPTVAGKLSGSQQGDAIQTMVKKYKGEWYVLAVNTTMEPLRDEFKLTGAKGEKLQVLFESRSIDQKAGVWNDLFKPMEAHVYKLAAN